MGFLTEGEKQTLEKEIIAAESRTSGEIVTVIAAESDGYRYIPTLWAALTALAVPGFYYCWQWLTSDGWTSTEGSSLTLVVDVHLLQVLVFFLLGTLFQFTAARYWLIPRSVKHQRASRHAREQFFLQNLHQTVGRTGVLIFVSVAEHYVEIIVDQGISEKIPDSEWEATVSAFVEHVRHRRVAQGFSETILHCGELLQLHFPADERNPDELPNPLIEV